MNKLGLIILFVIVGVLIILFMTSQNTPKSNILLPTPTPSLPPVIPSSNNSLELNGNSFQKVPVETKTSSTPTPTASQVQPIPEKPSRALIQTTKGNILLALYYDDAKGTVENFAKKAVSGFYKNLSFHRVEDWVVQGGDPKGDGTGGGVMPTEINKKPFVAGSLGVARASDIRISNDAQFFITKSDAVWLNGQYTNFGIVIDGMDVVNKIEVGDKILQIVVQ